MLSAAALRKVSKEIVSLQTSPPEGIRIQVDEANLANLVGWIEGPQGTPFEGGYFKVRFNFADSDFPNTPPKCTMATKIFHPNVAPSTGEICVSTLKKDWKREYGIAHILITVKCLLIHPNPESALHEEAGKLLLEAYEDYARHARLMTDVHARHRPSEFTTVSSAPQTSSSSSSASGSVPSTSAVPQLPTPSPRALPTTTTSVYTQPLANNENVDVVMHESMTAATGPSEMMKSPSSTSYAFGSGMINSSGVGTGGAVVAGGGPGSVIPKKRPPPSSAATPLSSFGNSVPPQPNSSIFGGSAMSSQAGMSAVKKGSGAVGGGAGSTTAAAQKKRGLKRL